VPGERVGGHHIWTADEIAKFRRHWKEGTPERRAMMLHLALLTRADDARKLGRANSRDGRSVFLRKKTAKSDASEVVLPIPAELARELEYVAATQSTFMVSRKGEPYSPKSYQHWFWDASVAAGIPGRSHGLRKARASQLATEGRSVPQIAAAGGWRSHHSVESYVRGADRRRNAEQALGPSTIPNLLSQPKTPAR
jgi:hypothetical protein